MDARITQRGLAKLQTTVGTLDAFVEATITSAKAKHEWDEQTGKDFGGFDVYWDGRNERVKLTISLELTATTAVIAKSYGAFLAMFAKVTLTNFDLEWLNADWCYFEGGDIDLSNTKVATASLSLRKYTNATQNAKQFHNPDGA